MRKRSAYGFWAGKLEGKRSFGMPRQRRNNKVKMNLQATKLDAVDYTDLAQDTVKWLALVHVVMKLHIPHTAGNSSVS
jgi:hypothetical protein